MQVTLSEKKIICYNIKMCMIYEQCNYFILLLLYDFEMENVEIKTNLNLETPMPWARLHSTISPSLKRKRIMLFFHSI